MIDFEEELKKFKPSLEVEEAEEAIYNQDLTDKPRLARSRGIFITFAKTYLFNVNK